MTRKSKLRKQAGSKIRESGEYKAVFITDALMELKENEIMKRRLAVL